MKLVKMHRLYGMFRNLSVSSFWTSTTEQKRLLLHLSLFVAKAQRKRELWCNHFHFYLLIAVIMHTQLILPTHASEQLIRCLYGYF